MTAAIIATVRHWPRVQRSPDRAQSGHLGDAMASRSLLQVGGNWDYAGPEGYSLESDFFLVPGDSTEPTDPGRTA